MATSATDIPAERESSVSVMDGEKDKEKEERRGDVSRKRGRDDSDMDDSERHKRARHDERDREKERERERERGKDKERERGRSERDRERRDKDKEKERSRSDKDKERERERERDRERDRERERDKERERARERERERDRERERKDSVEREPAKVKVEESRPEMKPEAESESETKKAAAQPLDLSELVTQTPAETDAKPVFLTKAQRRELALKKRQEEVAKQLALQEEERRAREAFLREAQQAAAPRYDSHRDRDRERERQREREREREREKERERAREREREKAAEQEKTRREAEDEERAKEREREEIKKAYMGLVENKKRVFKASEKFRFNFDWAADEDTSRDTNPLYNERLEIKPMFGRGFIGGADHTEQSEAWQREQEQAETTRKLVKLREELTRLTGPEHEEERARLRERIEVLEKREKINVHWSKKRLEEMTQRDWRIFKEDHNITTKGGGIPNPIRSWDEAPLPDWLRKAIDDAGYKTPTAIQMQAIPMGLAGRDILGIAQTGSGKTACFVIPMLCYIAKLPRMTKETQLDGPYALILAPTRELALQISKETEKFAVPGGYRTVLLVGGQDIEEQSRKLRAGCEIIVATPGRLKDCLDSSLVVLNQCNFIVLDEADRMIEEGFEQELLAILDSMPKDTLKSEEEELAEQQERQAAALLLPDAAPPAPRDLRSRFRTTFMFSATMPPPVERLSRRYLRRPGQIVVGAVGRAVDRIKQTVIFTRSEHDKRQHLEELIRNGPPPPIIVFVNQRKKTEVVATIIEGLGLKTTTLQGGLAQDVREECLQEFRDGKAQVLVATDVAGRGIDVKGVTHVINYDLPKDIDSYTHRIGRTGRAGASGLATSFLTNEDTEIMYDLKKMLMETNNAVPAELAQHEASKVKPGSIVQQPRHKTVLYAQ